MEIHSFLQDENNRINIGRKISEEGIVLLKNENGTLPVENEKIAVFGAAQINTMCVFGNSESLTEAMIKSGVNIDLPTFEAYKNACKNKITRQYCQWKSEAVADEILLPESAVTDAAKRARKAIIIIGRKSEENFDINDIVGAYRLSDDEEQLVKSVCRHFQKVILILNIGCNIDLEFTEKYNFGAIIYMPPVGLGGCNALSDILLGRVCPSGRLTSTLTRHYGDYPSAAHFGKHGGGTVQDYCEDIYVGYRYFDTFNKGSDVLYPFGFGLSYTSFTAEITDFAAEKGEIKAEICVKNTGNIAGKNVIELYFEAPNVKDGALLYKPKRELCGFEKTKLLKPNETEALSFDIKIDDLASYDDSGVLGTPHAKVLEKGKYGFYITENGKDFIKIGEYTEGKTRVTEQCHPLKTTLPKRLTGSGEYEALPTPPFNSENPIRLSALEQTHIPVSHFYACDKKITDLSTLSIGQSADYYLFAASGGGHLLDFGNPDILNKISLKINDTSVEVKAQNGGCTIILPMAAAHLTITAEDNLPSITEFNIKKLDNTVLINPEGETVINAAEIYEWSYAATLKNFEGENGEKGSYITNLYTSGTYFLFKTKVEQAGKYDLTIYYSSAEKEKPMENTFVMFVSNIVQPLKSQMLKTTHSSGEKRRFIPTEKSTVYLPAGDVYLKIAAEDTPVPDVSKLVLMRNENGTVEGEIPTEHIKEKNSADQRHYLEKMEYEQIDTIGIQLKDVYFDNRLMPEFLEQLSNRELATLVSGTAKNITETGDVGCTHPLEARGVPALQATDGPNSLRQKYRNPVPYPPMVTLTATFNKDYYFMLGEIMGEECLIYGADLFLGPSINIYRHAAGGRNWQYCSEDPYLSGILAIGYIKGLQSRGVAAVLKHYAANNSEFERLKSNSRVSERALREIYLKAFEMAVKEADPYMIMSSYNYINDKKSCEDYDLITTLPRLEWNWKGTFVTDWWNDSSHIAELAAGHDLKMPTGDIDAVTEALDSGVLSREQVKINAERVLCTVMKTARAKRLFGE